MTNYNKRYILAFDPSGSYNEGKGTTGWCVFDCQDNRVSTAGMLSAATYACFEEYVAAHVDLIKNFIERYKATYIHVVIEDYLLYESKARTQINSHMETSQLIGVLKYCCWCNSIEYTMQPASEVKTRWTNDILCYKKFIRKDSRKFELPVGHKEVNKHMLDSIRHAVHYATFKNKAPQKLLHGKEI